MNDSFLEIVFKVLKRNERKVFSKVDSIGGLLTQVSNNLHDSSDRE